MGTKAADSAYVAQNLVLFYALIGRHLTEMFPIVYTPTEADAIADYSHLFRRSEGLYLTPEEEGAIEEDFLDACDGRQLDLVRVFNGHPAGPVARSS